MKRDAAWVQRETLPGGQAGLGEASCLAMCAFFNARASITFWSSGTGFAGGCGLFRLRHFELDYIMLYVCTFKYT